MNRIKYSQNFLRDFNLVRSLISKSSISKNDTILEIGAGKGIITTELLNRAGKVIAYELDKQLLDALTQKFQGNQLLQLEFKDFLGVNLPNFPYKIFSNIPFNITSAIIKKLTLEDNPPEDAYLIVQKEAAMRFMGKPLDIKNSQLSVILHPWFEFRSMYEFKPDDFSPRPNVTIILLEIKKRNEPLIDSKNKDKYEDFITYTFSQPKPNITEGLSKVMRIEATNSKPSELDFEDWIDLFEMFLKLPEKQQSIVKGSFNMQLKQQENIEKINRTRVDEGWKKFRN